MSLLYLASLSPRRKHLLSQLGLSCQVLSVDVDETQQNQEPGYRYVSRLALNKARAGWNSPQRIREIPVCGADTALLLGDRILGKPASRDSALEMLRELSGKTHRVLTAVALVLDARESLAVSDSQVSFRTLSQAECERYWDTGEPQDKAGAYAIQGMGALFVSDLKGSYSGVMGLPLFETGRLLQEFGIRVL